MKNKMFTLLALLAILSLLSNCAQKTGSAAWCKQLAAKPKGDWTANEAADYARYCLLK